VGNVACMEDKENAYNNFTGRSEKRDFGVNGRIT
jgi:hypothetical protein